MSSKKVYTTVGFDREVLERLRQEGEEKKRSVSFLVDQRVRKSYEMAGGEKGAEQNAK